MKKPSVNDYGLLNRKSSATIFEYWKDLYISLLVSPEDFVVDCWDEKDFWDSCPYVKQSLALRD
jgi:hypothetical protein